MHHEITEKHLFLDQETSPLTPNGISQHDHVSGFSFQEKLYIIH